LPFFTPISHIKIKKSKPENNHFNEKSKPENSPFNKKSKPESYDICLNGYGQGRLLIGFEVNKAFNLPNTTLSL
jgi:hypothetical protein